MTASEKHHYGYFSARFLPVLKPFVAYARETEPIRFINGNILLEPCHEGGAYIVAITGHATLIIHDNDAMIDAPVTLDIPDAAFDIARGPAPVRMTFEGQAYECPAPEWAQPECVHVHTSGMFITTKMRNPDWAEEDEDFHPALYSIVASAHHHVAGSDFRLTSGVAFNWRGLLERTLNAPADTSGELCFNPVITALFGDLIELYRRVDPSIVIHHQLRVGVAGPVMLRLSGHPQIIGLWARMKDTEVADVPPHFLTPSATHAISEVRQ